MPCPLCRADVPPASRFCPSCGRAMPASDEATRLGTDSPVDLTRTSSPSAPAPAASEHERFPFATVIAHRYRLLGLIGRGGMGEVYRADDLRLGQPVALKFLPASIARDAQRLAQFHNEARTARQVSHPNVCRMYDIGEWEDQVFLTMEYVDGEDLSSLLRRIGRLPEDKATDIARQICAGLAAAHDRGILHRDLKPANIMLDGVGKVRIMDFSLASAGDTGDPRAGTPAYMAPEQLRGEAISRQSDIYSLGLVLYELFTGHRAFDANSLAELIDQRQSASVTTPTEWIRTLDPAIERAILRCLADDPRQRPASALAVSAALPGGDPLAAALAAGETPSPDMVAAAGGESPTMSGQAGVGWILLVCVLSVAVGALGDRTSVLGAVPFDKPRAVLIDRAETFRQRFGYVAPVTRPVSGFRIDGAYLSWAEAHGAGANGWADLSRGRPAAVRFWYRTGPSTLVPYNDLGAVTPNDPPPLVAGMIREDLDMQGRLLRFEAVPVAGLEAVAPAVDWAPLFDAAGFDRTAFSEVPATLRIHGSGDERHAWESTGRDPSAVRWHIDAAGYQGRPTLFEVSGDWDSRDRPPGSTPGGSSRVAAFLRVAPFLVLGLLPIGAAILARRNILTGRSDRRGAFRTWAFAFGTSALAWVVSPWHVADLVEVVDRMYAAFGQILYRTGELYLLYLALEPYVRRTWPTVLVTWSRVVSGRFRDPLVGRDLVAGAVGGLMVATAGPLFVQIPHWMGWPQPQPLESSLTPLLGGQTVLMRLLVRPTNSLSDAMIIMLSLSLIRQALRWAAGSGSGVLTRVVRSQGLLWLASISLFVFLIKRDGFDATYPWTDALVTAATAAALIAIGLRFGLFAVTVALFVFGFGSEIGSTLDASKPYADSAWCMAIAFIALTAIGAWLARAGRPMFSDAT